MHVPVYKWGGKTHIKTNFFQYHCERYLSNTYYVKTSSFTFQSTTVRTPYLWIQSTTAQKYLGENMFMY